MGRPDSGCGSVVAADQRGHILFIFTRSPYTVHDFVDMLLADPQRHRRGAAAGG